MLDAAEGRDLASIWLLFQPDEKQIGLVTVVAQTPGRDAEERASNALTSLESGESLSKYLAEPAGARKIFDRTSLNLSLWLPWSRLSGGDAALFPTFPVYPLPQPATETKVP
jgi:hypothetical protein